MSHPACPTASHRRVVEYIPDDPLLTAHEAAAERRQGLSTFWRDVKRGRVPSAIYVSPRCPRWRRSELRAALEANRAPQRPEISNGAAHNRETKTAGP